MERLKRKLFLNLLFYTIEAEMLANAKHSDYQHPARMLNSSTIVIGGRRYRDLERSLPLSVFWKPMKKHDGKLSSEL